MPRPRTVCFVCGSYGAESRLSTKQQDRPCPYFPFLENHDPPKGARLPGKDGFVDCCRVCYAFLTSQWEAYERSRTPAIKRLYWLKRSDNGHFTGAEMRLQGEYIAQVMGLQYQPGVFEGESPQGEGTMTEPNLSPTQNQPPEGKRRAEYSQPQTHVGQNYSSGGGSNKGTVYQSERSAADANVHSKTSRQVDHVPSNRSVIDDGALDLSVASKKPMSASELRGNLPYDRKMDSKLFTCFICLKQHVVSSSKLINSCRQPTSEPYFPVLGHLPQAKEPNALTKQGQVRVCLDCKNLLYQQWQAYEMSGIPIQNRTYSLSEESPLSKHLERVLGPKSGMKEVNASIERPSNHHVCYLCGHMYLEDAVQSLYTVLPRETSLGTLFFPFVRELQRPQGAQPLKSDGTVLACRNCYRELYCQWQTQETSGIPVYHRQYSLSFLGKKIPQHELSRVTVKQETVDRPENYKGPASSSSSSDVSQPLNIQISESSVLGNDTSQPNTGSQGLLAIATGTTMNSGVCADSLNPPTSTSPASWVAQNKKAFSEQSNTKPSLTVPHPLQQVTAMPKKVCFLCGEKCKLTKLHILCSYPARHDTKAPNSQVAPFFPFLANKDPAPGADSMTEDGTVLSCNICYLSLMKQWAEFEESKNPTESNRWLRKYTLPDVICCYVCSNTVKRSQLQTLNVSKFSFLKDHNVSSQTLIVDGGERVGVCGNCGQSLMHQFVEYERLGLPIEMRKYNWSLAENKPSESENNKQDEDDQQLLCVDENSSDSHSSIDVTVERQTEHSADGLGQGSKPPPLTMISPAAAKLSRNTATVPPLNQSPSNGVTSMGANSALNATRTSSFAAALRKLAHQAKDPEEGSGKHSTQSAGSSTSPRAVTPKRGPPPLVYSSHSSLTSPPVVTIAPTQSHPSLVSSEAKQSLDRTHPSQNSVSSTYESLNVKQERDRPQSTHSNREEDRTSSKDASSSRRPHSGHSSTSPATNREELARGFQPYRPGDDMRHQLPPTAFGLDPSAYPYPAAFLAPHFPHPAFRFDDPVLLERYRMMQPPYMPFAHPGMLPTPGVHPFLPGGRYPADILHQQFPFVSQTSHISPALSERQRLEEERIRELEREKEREREREKEREAALQREKERAREREKEYEKEKARELYFSHHHQQDHRPDRSRDFSRREVELSRLSKSDDAAGSKFGAILHGAGRDYSDRTEKVRPYNDSRDTNNGGYTREGDRYDDRTMHKKDERLLNNHSSEQPLYKTHGLDRQEFEKRMLYASKHSESEKIYKENGSAQFASNRIDLTNKPVSKDSSFFRPFDTNILTNGFNGSHVSDFEKYSSRFKSGESPVKSQHSRTGIDRSDLMLREESESYKRLASSRGGDDKKIGDSISVKSTEDMSKFSKADHNQFSEDLNSDRNSSSKGSHDSKTFSKLNKEQQYFESNFSQFSVNDYHRHRGSSSLQYNIPHPSIVSRLDIEEQKLREKRSKENYCSDDSDDNSVDEDEEEERRKHRLLLISSGPPLELDTSKPKMVFLRHIGLTSQKVKRDLEHEKLRKRRHLHRERSVSPILLEEEETETGECSLPVPAPNETEILCRAPDFQEKCKFLGSMSLSTLSPEKRKELKYISKVCDDERMRRLVKSTEHSGLKRKSHDTKDGSTCSKLSLLSHGERVPGGGKGHHKGQAIQAGESAADRTSFLFTNKDRSLSKEFAQEFHESVLQTTRQKELNNRLGLSNCQTNENRANNTENTSHLQSNMSSRSGHRQHQDTSTIKWPGIEVLLESYQQHIQEQKLERSVLLDRCHHLQVDNQDLNRTAESLSKRMAELMENKQLLLENRAKCQDSIDAMKRCVRDIR